MNLLQTILSALFLLGTIASASPPDGSPVARNGQLGTKGNHIVNERGEITQLRGLCTHGLQWHGDVYKSGDDLKSF